MGVGWRFEKSSYFIYFSSELYIFLTLFAYMLKGNFRDPYMELGNHV